MSTFDDERRMQPYMDDWYKNHGYSQIDRTHSCKQFDCIINKNGNALRIEEKFLFTPEYKQMLVEIIQDATKADIGWFYHVDCHYLAWIYCDETRINPPKKIYLIRWPLFKRFVLQMLTNVGETSKWTSFNICTKNYGITINLPVNWSDLTYENIATSYQFDGLDF